MVMYTYNHAYEFPIVYPCPECGQEDISVAIRTSDFLEGNRNPHPTCPVYGSCGCNYRYREFQVYVNTVTRILYSNE